MSFLHLLPSIVLAVAMACSACARRDSPALSWDVKFGPVLGNELIVGHVVEGPTAWLATGGDTLVRIDLNSARHTRTPVHPLQDGEHMWGLAITPKGETWTLIGRATLAQIGEGAEIVRRIGLAEPHVGLFGSGRDLVFQVMNLHPPGDALAAGPPGGATRHPWSNMRTRDLPFTRGAVAALNLVSCGSSADRSGASREIPLDGLPIVAPELLLASDNPRRPVRDAFVTAGKMVWVLGSGEPPEGDTSTRPGGWLLAQYDLEGRLFRRVQLPEPARVLLGAVENTCLLLAWDGRVVEVRL
jgi:hypothetical protein